MSLKLDARRRSGRLSRPMATSPFFRSLLVGCFLVAAVLSASPATASTLTLTLDQTGLTASGVTPGGTVAWFGAWKYRHRYWTEPGRLDERSVDTDSDGTVTFDWTWEAGRELPYAGIFVVVDLATGDHALATPSHFLARQIPVSGGGLSLTGSELQVRSRALWVMTTRPGEDPWTVRAQDGGSKDPSAPGAPTTDGFIHLDPGVLERPHTDGPALTAWISGDTVIGIDTDTLQYFALEVP